MSDVRLILDAPMSDERWRDMVAVLDQTALRELLPQIEFQVRRYTSRIAFVEMLLALEPEPVCDCDRRWHTDQVDHSPGCARLQACTCAHRWISSSTSIADHASNCALHNGEPSG